jgi:signal transduction histidine kinase
VDLHGGGVSAHSEGPGLGTTFTVRLPLAAAPCAVAGVALD